MGIVLASLQKQGEDKKFAIVDTDSISAITVMTKDYSQNANVVAGREYWGTIILSLKHNNIVANDKLTVINEYSSDTSIIEKIKTLSAELLDAMLGRIEIVDATDLAENIDNFYNAEFATAEENRPVKKDKALLLVEGVNLLEKLTGQSEEIEESTNGDN